MKISIVLKVGVKVTPALSAWCTEREVNNVKHRVTDSCPPLVNQ